MFRLIHLVQGLSCFKQSVMQWSMVCSPSTVKTNVALAFAGRHGSPMRRKGQPRKGGKRGERKVLHTRSHVICYKRSISKPY